MNGLQEQIAQIKRERNAVILAHNYQLPEVQDLADHVGDSLELSRIAAKTGANVIVFCGVHFMAETAKILSPEKTVLLPARDAGCPMADMLSADQLRELKVRHPEALVVTYVNSTAEVKAETDYCCTSANALAVVKAIGPDRAIIFGPDQYLGQWVAEQTGRDLVLWQGYCPTHVRILIHDVRRMRSEHPDALLIAHPECRKDVRDAADAVLSTGGMVRYVRESPAEEFIVATELGMIHRLRKEAPGKRFYCATEAAICPNMKRIDAGTVLWALQNMQYRIEIPEDVRQKAQAAVDRMVAITGA